MSAFATPGPSTVTGEVGGVLVGTYISGSTENDTPLGILNGPPGVTLTSRGGASYGGHLDLTGSPTTPGVWDAKVQHIYGLSAGDPAVLEEQDVRFIIGGIAGLKSVLTWFHDEPDRADLQIDVRTGIVRSGAFDLASAGVALVRGEPRIVHILFLDAGQVLTDLPSHMRLVARTHAAPDAPVLFRQKWDAADVETINSASRPFITITPAGRVIDEVFSAFNAVATAQAGSASLTGVIELTYTLAGITRTAVSVPVTIRQDIEQ